MFSTLIGSHDLLFITLDTLRYDVAQEQFRQGCLPTLTRYLPPTGWEERHSPASFTYAAHHAFFAGFLPTPVAPGRHPRLFSARFPGSETTTETTLVFDEPDLPTGLAQLGYHTLCIGGVGFFNKQSALGSALPSLFKESYWDSSLGVTDPHSTEHQVTLARSVLERLPPGQRLFLFLNVSALHQPNYFYLPDNADKQDTLASHAAALTYVDAQLAPLFPAMQRRAPTLVILCSDHGTAYGEDGYYGHRIAHPVVWIVPYAQFVLPYL
ncbi:MAG TPA: STM4013/SEN3800 family hydrolase [Ktedonobacteraceae bacterium]|jgi:arylsulfatase A-like enzyme